MILGSADAILTRHYNSAKHCAARKPCIAQVRNARLNDSKSYKRVRESDHFLDGATRFICRQPIAPASPQLNPALTRQLSIAEYTNLSDDAPLDVPFQAPPARRASPPRATPPVPRQRPSMSSPASGDKEVSRSVMSPGARHRCLSEAASDGVAAGQVSLGSRLDSFSPAYLLILSPCLTP